MAGAPVLGGAALQPLYWAARRGEHTRSMRACSPGLGYAANEKYGERVWGFQFGKLEQPIRTVVGLAIPKQQMRALVALLLALLAAAVPMMVDAQGQCSLAVTPAECGVRQQTVPICGTLTAFTTYSGVFYRQTSPFHWSEGGAGRGCGV